MQRNHLSATGRTLLMFVGVYLVLALDNRWSVAEDPTGRELLERAITRRFNDWSTAHVMITIYTNGSSAPLSRWEVFIEGARRKGLAFEPSSSSKPENGSLKSVSRVVCADCYQPNTVARFTPDDSAAPSDTTVAIYDTALLPILAAWIPDPHMVGLVPCSIFMAYDINVSEYYDTTNNSDYLISDDTIDGEPYIRLSRSAPGTELDIWIDERRSKSVGKARLISKFGDGVLVDEVRTDYVETNGKWLPLTSEYHREKDGTEVMRDLVKFEFLDFGQELPAGTFDLASFPGLKAGAIVTWVMPKDRPSPFPGSALVWNGKAIVGERAHEARISNEDNGARVSMLFWVNAVCLCGIVLAFVVRRLYLRGLNSKPDTRK